jgi:multiple sugar transport system permease protein
MMMTPVAVSLVWKSMYNFSYGIVNYYLGFVGLQSPWLSQPWSALLAAIIVDVWQWTPFVVIIALAGLYSLPVDPFEAAEIDGASGWKKLRHITLPLLKPLLLVALLIRICDSFKIFDNIYVLTMGGPGLATEVLSLSIYKANFFYRQVGKAAAMSLLMLVIAIIIAQLLIRALRRERVG